MGRSTNVYVKSHVLRCSPSVLVEVRFFTVQQNLAVVGPTAGFCSVKRFVYAALLLCTSDSRCQQLLQTRQVFGRTFLKVDPSDHLWTSNHLLRCGSSSRSAGTKKAACVVDLFSFTRLCCAFLCPLARPRPPSWILMIISFKKCVTLIFSFSCRVKFGWAHKGGVLFNGRFTSPHREYSAFVLFVLSSRDI